MKPTKTGARPREYRDWDSLVPLAFDVVIAMQLASDETHALDAAVTLLEHPCFAAFAIYLSSDSNTLRLFKSAGVQTPESADGVPLSPSCISLEDATSMPSAFLVTAREEVFGLIQIATTCSDPIVAEIIPRSTALNLALALSRLRRSQERNEAIADALYGSRELAATELMAGMIHSFSHSFSNLQALTERAVQRAQAIPHRDMIDQIMRLRDSVDAIHRSLREYGALFLDSRDDANYSSFHSLLKDVMIVWKQLDGRQSTKITVFPRAHLDTCRLGKKRAREILLIFLISACADRHARNVMITTCNENSVEAPSGNYISDSLLVEWTDDGEEFGPHVAADTIFDPSQLATRSGLGMYLARRYSRAAGGDLQHMISPSGGVTLRLILPVTKDRS